MNQVPPDPPPHKHCHRYNTPGHYHYLTFSCFRQQPFLSRDRSRHWLVDAISTTKEKQNFSLIAFVIMPEHAHLLIHPRAQKYSISTILSSIKLPVTRKAGTYVAKHAPTFLERMRDIQPNGTTAIRFWQRGGGYDRNIFTAEELWEKINYIHQNPVRRKLVLRAQDWPWSSAADYAGTRAGPIPLDKNDLPWTT